FNGMWSSTVIGAQIVDGKTAMVCNPPRLEAFLQRRRTPRAILDVPVNLHLEKEDSADFPLRSQDISSSGIALVTPGQMPEAAEVGESVKLTIAAPSGQISATARVIRIDHNWLANKTVMGLEFTDMDDESAETLIKLLDLLGCGANVQSEETAVSGNSKLFGWKGTQRGERDDKSFVRGQALSESEPTDD
ncbi:MAG TPA: PilZ domain-containing protein, partial [Candidatus Obscuribacterales bacterium]